MCGSKMWGIILSILIIIFALWETAYSVWIVVIAAVIMLIMYLIHPVKSAPKQPVKKKK
ncbi:MAG: hypothetical protein ABIG28_00050 [archaeon]